MGKWDVARTNTGEPITITPDQSRAIWHAISVVESVRLAEGYDTMFNGSVRANLGKSRLLGRMLLDGRPPLDVMPELYVAARGYHLVEPNLRHYYLGDVFMIGGSE